MGPGSKEKFSKISQTFVSWKNESLLLKVNVWPPHSTPFCIMAAGYTFGKDECVSSWKKTMCDRFQMFEPASRFRAHALRELSLFDFWCW